MVSGKKKKKPVPAPFSHNNVTLREWRKAKGALRTMRSHGVDPLEFIGTLKHCKAAMLIQRRWRAWHAYNCAAYKIQTAYRLHLARYAHRTASCMLIQCAWRMRRAGQLCGCRSTPACGGLETCQPVRGLAKRISEVPPVLTPQTAQILRNVRARIIQSAWRRFLVARMLALPEMPHTLLDWEGMRCCYKIGYNVEQVFVVPLRADMWQENGLFEKSVSLSVCKRMIWSKEHGIFGLLSVWLTAQVQESVPLELYNKRLNCRGDAYLWTTFTATLDCDPEHVPRDHILTARGIRAPCNFAGPKWAHKYDTMRNSGFAVPPDMWSEVAAALANYKQRSWNPVWDRYVYVQKEVIHQARQVMSSEQLTKLLKSITDMHATFVHPHVECAWMQSAGNLSKPPKPCMIPRSKAGLIALVCEVMDLSKAFWPIGEPRPTFKMQAVVGDLHDLLDPALSLADDAELIRKSFLLTNVHCDEQLANQGSPIRIDSWSPLWSTDVLDWFLGTHFLKEWDASEKLDRFVSFARLLNTLTIYAEMRKARQKLRRACAARLIQKRWRSACFWLGVKDVKDKHSTRNLQILWLKPDTGEKMTTVFTRCPRLDAACAKAKDVLSADPLFDPLMNTPEDTYKFVKFLADQGVPHHPPIDETKEERIKRKKRESKRLRKLRKRELSPERGREQAQSEEQPAPDQATASGPTVHVLRSNDPTARDFMCSMALWSQLTLHVQLRKARARLRERCEARRQRRLTMQRAFRKALYLHSRKLRHDQLAWEAGAPEREKERRRKELAAAGRARNQAGQGNTLPSDTLPRPQPGAKPGKSRAVVRTETEQRKHETWADPSEREGRRQKFDAKQQAEADQAAAAKEAAAKAAARAAEVEKGKKEADRFKHAAAPLSLRAFVAQPQTRLKSLKDWSPPKADPPSPEEEDGRSVISVATSHWPIPTPSNHAGQRAAEHGATLRQLQRTMKHGPVELSAHGTDDAPRLVHRGEAGGFDVVTDATGAVAITTHPARASQARARNGKGKARA